MTSTLRGSCPAPDRTGCQHFRKQNLTFETIVGAWGQARTQRTSGLCPRRLPWPQGQEVTSMWPAVPRHSPRAERMLLWNLRKERWRQTSVTWTFESGGAVAFSMGQQRIPLAFILLRKNSKLPLGLWGQIFNVAVTLNRNIQFKWCKAMW